MYSNCAASGEFDILFCMGEFDLRRLGRRHGLILSVSVWSTPLSDLHLLHCSVVFVAIVRSRCASVQKSIHSQGLQKHKCSSN